MGYLACRAVNDTETAHRQITIQPVIGPEMTGVGVMYQRYGRGAPGDCPNFRPTKWDCPLSNHHNS